MTKRRRFTVKDDAAIRAGRAQGLGWAEIARRLGRDRSSICARAARLGLAPARLDDACKADLRPPRRDRPARRHCLKCRTRFQPEHRLNYVCRPCKAGRDWHGGVVA